jgi:hypothetical protein
MRLRFSIRVVSALLLFAATAQAQFTFSTNNGALTITGFSGTGNVTIPAATNGMPIVGIATMAFRDCRVTSVTIPASVTNIGSQAFIYCSFLTNATIDSGVVGDGAFESTASLTTLTLGNGVTKIGNQAFEFCSSLNILVLPANIINIGQSAFQGCSGLANLSISGSNASIGDMAFFQCTNLANVTILNGITNIGNSAFAYCSKLTNFAIPGSVISIGPGAFAACAKLAAINVAAQNGFYTSFDGVLFDKDMTSLLQYPAGLANAYTVPPGVTNIGYESFLGAHVITVALPKSLMSLGMDAFLDCAFLSSIAIPAGVTDIPDNAFAGCSSLTNVSLSAGLSSIAAVAFSACALQNITIPGSVTNIGSDAFLNCVHLTNIFFGGDAPAADSTVFSSDGSATVYYLPGTAGWSSNYQGLPTALWNPAMLNASVANNQFAFYITGTSNIPIVLQASANLAGPWSLLQSLNLTNGLVAFSDPLRANREARYYRISAP